MPSSRETTAPARVPRLNRRPLPRCMHGCSSEMTSTDPVCVPTSFFPTTRSMPSPPSAAQPSRRPPHSSPPRFASRAAAGGGPVVGAEPDMRALCFPRQTLFLLAKRAARDREIEWMDRRVGERRRGRGPLTDGGDEDLEDIFRIFTV